MEQVGVGAHLAVTAVYAVLAVWHLWRGAQTVQQKVYGIAFATTAAWAAATVIAGPASPLASLAENGRNFLWLTFVLLLFRDGGGFRRQTVVSLYAVLAMAMLLNSALGFVPPSSAIGGVALNDLLFFAGLALRILILAGGLVLLHNLYDATARDRRWGIRGPLVAIALMWLWDLNLYTITYLSGRWPETLLTLRGFLMLALLVPFGMVSRRQTPFRLRLSRAAAFQSVSLLAIGGYLVFMVLATRAMALLGGENNRTAQVALVLVMTLAAAALLPSPRVRAWLRVVIAKHFFQHRYDYREEWLRFTGTLGRPGERAAPLESRVIKAIADITESPGGLLLVIDDQGALTMGSRYNWGPADPPAAAGSAAFATHVEATGRILELDALRGADPAADEERALTPDWLLAEPAAWIAVPLIHLDRLAGIVVVERPRLARNLDWEDFDLLKVAGRQIASYLAEARTQEALSEAKRFDEFNRRFAFILHDIKNLVSQLSLVARNAERHADKPEFRADMVATLQSSVGKMNALLALLSQHNRTEPAAPRPLPLGGFVRSIVEARRDPNPLLVEADDRVVAMADPARLEQALIHIVQNAIDASADAAPVRLSVARDGDRAAIRVEDQGRGMSPDFIRSGLFKPFASTKANGFGVGAFEARALVGAMGGRMEVESRVGEGSRFTLILPLAPQAAMAGELAGGNG